MPRQYRVTAFGEIVAVPDRVRSWGTEVGSMTSWA